LRTLPGEGALVLRRPHIARRRAPAGVAAVGQLESMRLRRLSLLGSEQEFAGHPAFAGFLPFTPAGPLGIGLLQRCLIGNVCRLFARIFGWHRGRRRSPGRSSLPETGWETPRRGRDIMSMNRPPSHPGLFGWSNAQLVSGFNADNTSLNQQLTTAIAPCFAPASRRIPSPRRRSDGDSSGREHPPKPRPHALNRSSILPCRLSR